METHTADMQLAAYLEATGHSLLRIDGSGRKKVFIFNYCNDEVKKFYTRKGQVEARELFDSYRNLRALVFDN